MKNIRQILLLSLLLSLLFTQQSLAFNTKGLEINITAGFRYDLAPKTWIPVTIQLSNTSEEVNGKLVLKSKQKFILTGESKETEYLIPITLPSSSQRIYRTTIFNPPASDTSLHCEFSSQGKVLFSKDLFLKQILSKQNLLVITDLSSGYEFANTSPWSVFYLTPELLPVDSIAYWGIEAIIIDRADLTRLNSRQINAILTWVAQGKTIILTGGNSRASLRSPLVSRLFSGKIGGKEVLHLNGSDKEELLFTGDNEFIEIYQLEKPSTGKTLIERKGKPLLITEQINDGILYFFTFDPYAPNLYSRSKREQLFSSLLSSSIMETKINHGILDYMVPDLLRSVPYSLPSRFWIIGLTIAFICLLYFFYIRYKIRKINLFLKYTVLILITIIYSGFVVLLFNLGMRPNKQVLSEIAIINKSPLGSYAAVESYYALFSRETSGLEVICNRPTGAVTSLSPQAGSDLNEVLKVTISDDQQMKIKFSNQYDNWSSLGFRGNYFTRLPLFLETKKAGDKLQIRLANSSKLSVERLLLYQNNNWFELGPVNPGDTGTFEIDSTTPEADSTRGIPLYPLQKWGRLNEHYLLRQELLNRVAGRLFHDTIRQIADNELSENQTYILCLIRGQNLPEGVQLNKAGIRELFGFWIIPVF